MNFYVRSIGDYNNMYQTLDYVYRIYDDILYIVFTKDNEVVTTLPILIEEKGNNQLQKAAKDILSSIPFSTNFPTIGEYIAFVKDLKDKIVKSALIKISLDVYKKSYGDSNSKAVIDILNHFQNLSDNVDEFMKIQLDLNKQYIKLIELDLINGDMDCVRSAFNGNESELIESIISGNDEFDLTEISKEIISEEQFYIMSDYWLPTPKSRLN